MHINKLAIATLSLFGVVKSNPIDLALNSSKLPMGWNGHMQHQEMTDASSSQLISQGVQAGGTNSLRPTEQDQQNKNGIDGFSSDNENSKSTSEALALLLDKLKPMEGAIESSSNSSDTLSNNSTNRGPYSGGNKVCSGEMFLPCYLSIVLGGSALIAITMLGVALKCNRWQAEHFEQPAIDTSRDEDSDAGSVELTILPVPNVFGATTKSGEPQPPPFIRPDSVIPMGSLEPKGQLYPSSGELARPHSPSTPKSIKELLNSRP